VKGNDCGLRVEDLLVLIKTVYVVHLVEFVLRGEFFCRLLGEIQRVVVHH
jgi:hypothetical protein